jgi:hypothetical protein
MPIHDWTRVDAGLFHAFRFGWISYLSQALNTGALPSDYYALTERRFPDPLPQDLDETRIYAHRADRIGVHDRRDQLVAVVDIVSPGNKAYETELRSFASAAAGLIMQGVHLLVIDLFPPTQRDPQGIHKAIWDQFDDEEFELPADKPLTLAAYQAEPQPAAYVEPVAVGDPLPDMPIFLKPGYYVPAPLETTYQTAWSVFPAPLKRLLETPPAPSRDS